MTRPECQMRYFWDRIELLKLVHRCSDAFAQRYLDTSVTAMWRYAEIRRGLFTLLSVLLLTISATPSSAINPEAICFAGSGKPKTDIVMCSMALMSSPPLTRATLLTSRARARIQLEDDALALEDLTEALAINPLSAEALTEKGQVLRFLGQPAAARDALDKALQLSPYDTRARKIRGILALTLGDHASAIMDLSAVIAVDPARGESHALRGIAHYYVAENPTASLQDFREADDRGFTYDYLPLWIALVQRSIGEDSEHGLQQARAALLGDQDWPTPVITMYLEPGPAALTAALDLATRGTPGLRRARAGQVHFLNGELLRLRGAPGEAQIAFEAAVLEGDPRTIEYALATQRLTAYNPAKKGEKN